MNQYLLFDLDGTLTDSAPGITNCVKYALESFGIQEEDPEKLLRFVGPPLDDSFMRFYGLSEEDATKAIAKFRERYIPTGVYENSLYPGIRTMLARLKMRGARLAVASSKLESMVHTVLQYFHIEEYFDVVVGSLADGTRKEKDAVVKEVLHQFFPDGKIDYENTVMIGDRKFDVEGAKKFGLQSVAVAYGAGDIEELMESGADTIVLSVKELEKVLLRGRKFYGPLSDKKSAYMYEPKKPIVIVFSLFMPIAIYYLVSDFLRLTSLLIWKEQTPILRMAVFLIMAVVMYFLYGAKELHQARFSYRVRNANCERFSDPIKRGAITGSMAFIVLIIFAFTYSCGMNALFSLVHLPSLSETFQEVSATQMAVELPLAVLLYGLFSPLAEELVFRGIVFNRFKKFYSRLVAVLVSSLLFGVYHGNIVQAAYGFITGILLCLVYEYSGSLFTCVLFHGIVNITGVLINMIAPFNHLMMNGISCLIALILTILGGIVLYITEKRVRNIF